MKTLALITTALLLVACGAETATSAATIAAAKKKEVEQAEATQAQVQRQLDDANALMQKRLEEADRQSR